MFTGLIEDIGTIRAVRPAGTGLALTIATGIPIDEVRLGDSIAVNGACGVERVRTRAGGVERADRPHHEEDGDEGDNSDDDQEWFHGDWLFCF